jgi:hypothetical protein
MSLASWYLHKAEQCAQLAKNAADARRRSDFESEQISWLRLAQQVERDELPPQSG